jgi:hypothetical protein
MYEEGLWAVLIPSKLMLRPAELGVPGCVEFALGFTTIALRGPHFGYESQWPGRYERFPPDNSNTELANSVGVHALITTITAIYLCNATG